MPTGYIQRMSRKCAHDEDKTMKWVLLQFSRQECVLGNLAETIILSFDSHFVFKDTPKRACRDVTGYAQKPKKAQLSTPPQASNKVVRKPACALPHFKTCGLFNSNFPLKFCKKLPPLKWLKNMEQWPLIPA